MKLLICYLTDSRRHYTFEPFLHFILQSKRKTSWTLAILTHEDDCAFYHSRVASLDINSVIVQVEPDNNYLHKVSTAAQMAEKQQIPYVMKCDNDLFFSGETLDYMIDHLDLLEQNTHLTLGPVLTNGIPTVEYFIRDFMEPSARNELYRRFLETRFVFRDGADYTPLNEHTLDSLEWCPDAFFDSVAQLPIYYKGMHPIRMNPSANHYLNNYVVSHAREFFERTPTGIIGDNRAPYLCNSVFCIRTSTYLSILRDISLFVDGYDEVPLNKWAEKTGLRHAYVENGFAFHMMYNWVGNHLEYERQICASMFESPTPEKNA